MAVTPLVVTAGSASANAYVSLAVANQFHLDRPAAGTTWSDATDDQKNAAILWATKLLDMLWRWNGWAVDAVQALAWPRAGLWARNQRSNLSTTAIPIEIQHATAEFARQLIASDLAADSDIGQQKITSIRAGSVALTFGEGVAPEVVPLAVWALIPREWGTPINRQGSGVRNLVRA